MHGAPSSELAAATCMLAFLLHDQQRSHAVSLAGVLPSRLLYTLTSRHHFQCVWCLIAA
jgi:hypothetical protein